MNNKLYVGDNLAIMRSLPDESVDLIATDPPFYSKKNYKEFDDRWSSLEEFIEFMRLRLIEMRRLLKETGSIYVHCDQSASHYLKVEMDKIFGRENFRNDIIWGYNKWSNTAKFFQKNHDNILYYSKTNNYTFNPIYGNLTESTKKLRTKGYHIHYKQNALLVYDDTKPKVQELINSNKFDKIYYEKGNDGVVLSDNWNDISLLNSMANERTGYPTQKPLALYQRIIQASSNEGGLILDPFCGSGTTLDAAQSLNRRWIGIDKNANAVDYIKKRFDKYGLLQPNYEVIHE